MPIHSYTAHVQELEAFGMGYPLHGEARDRAVLGSWRRCIDQHRLDPSRTSEAHIVPAGQLRAHREESESLIRIARSGLERLYQQLKGLDYVLLLADRHGVAVDFLGHDSDASDLRSAGLYLGAQWREDVAGTSAVGTCLATGEALTVHQSDHFDFTHTRLSCTAAPIYDLQGQLAAVLDLSLLRSPAARASQQMALHLVTAAVRRVELANLMAQSGSDWVLRLAQSPDFLDVDADAALSVDARGRIRAMTHAASRMLASIAGLNWRQQPLLTGQPLGRFFDTDLQALPQLMRNRPAQERILRARDGSIWFAHALPPQPRSSAQASPRPSLPAPLQALNTGDAAMGQVLHKAARLAPQDLPVLLQGETGSGKEFLARALHAASGRSGAFVAINCAALPEHLLESELFGYTDGAFTGAVKGGKAGLFELAHKGTLFLDEIVEMPFNVQAKLLRVLQEREVRKIGADMVIPVDVRIITAANSTIIERVREGAFRLDLFYRISLLTLTLIPLRDRKGDLGILFRHFVSQYCSRHSIPKPTITDEAIEALYDFPWPGNIRELRNAAERLAILHTRDVVKARDMDALDIGSTSLHITTEPAASKPMRTTVSDEELYEQFITSGLSRELFAKQVGISRTTLWRKFARLGE